MVGWSEALSVGHRGVDEQHRDLINRVNALNDAVGTASDGDAEAVARIAAMAAEFFAAFKTHAAYEELAMHQFFYGNVERHAEHHTLHMDVIATLLLAEPVVEVVRLNLPFINSTVFDHIDRDDRDFGAHLKAMGLFGRV